MAGTRWSIRTGDESRRILPRLLTQEEWVPYIGSFTKIYKIAS